MNPLNELLQWYNFIFVFPLFAGLLALLVSAYGAAFEAGGGAEHEQAVDHEADAGMEHEVEAEHDIDVEHDISVEHDIDAEVEHDLETAVEHDIDAEAEHDLGAGGESEQEAGHETEAGAGTESDHGVLHTVGHAGSAMLAFLGASDAPFTLVLESLLLWWGAIGWLANQAWSQLLPRPELFIWPSLATALLGSVGLTRGTSKLLGRVLPRESTSVLDSEELEAQVGEAVFAITTTSGWVQLHDRFGTLHQVPARIDPGEDPIPRGRKVLLLRYEDEAGVYRVEPADWWDDDPSSPPRLTEDSPSTDSILERD